MTRRGGHPPGRLLAPTEPKNDRTQPDGPDLQTLRALADLEATGSIDELVELAHYLTPAEQLRGHQDAPWPGRRAASRRPI